MKIGILGGTFNPIHIGHLLLAENSYYALNLDSVIFMPSGISYLKNQNEIAASDHRINMVKLAIADNSHFKLSTMETERKGNTYTYETLSALKSQNTQDELYFIGGADTLMNIESWKCPELIFKYAALIIAPRNFLDSKVLTGKAELLKSKYNADVYILDTPNIEISSSYIRENIKDNNSLRYLLPDKVIEYIHQNNLYKDF